MATERARQKAAQAWCRDSTSHLVMCPELAEAFAEILDAERHQAFVDCRAQMTKTWDEWYAEYQETTK